MLDKVVIANRGEIALRGALDYLQKHHSTVAR